MSNGQFTAGRKARRVLTSLFAVSCSTAAAADPQPSDTVPAPAPVSVAQARSVVGAIFDRLDCDMDGTVETAEVDDHFAQVWHPTDRDKSRNLSPSEYSRLHVDLTGSDTKALFNDADADADGKVSAGELRLHLQRLIQQIDPDNDNEITRADAGMEPPVLTPPGRKAKKAST